MTADAIPEPIQASKLDEFSGPTVAKLMAAGFEPGFRVARLPKPIEQADTVKGGVIRLVTSVEFTATPQRAPATKCPGPARGEILSNVSIEQLAYEVQSGGREVRDSLANKAAEIAAEFIAREVPGVLDS